MIINTYTIVGAIMVILSVFMMIVDLGISDKVSMKTYVVGWFGILIIVLSQLTKWLR